MDEQRFDALTRSLAAGRSRRGVLRGLLGGVAAGLFARGPLTAEADAPRALRPPRSLRTPRTFRDPRTCRAGQSPDCAIGCCPTGTVCFDDTWCLEPGGVPCFDGECPADHTCTASGGCLPPGGIECGTGYCEGDHVCVNEQGCLPPGGTACGSGYCPSGQVCLNGQCERACAGGTVRCDHECVDTASDPIHCGGCGVACAPGQVCGGGVCSCPAGTELCGGECVDLLTNEDHCGACDTRCQATACFDATCVEGQCQRTPIPNCCAEDADCDDGNPCTVNTCDSATSTCQMVNTDFGEPCPPDGEPCTEDICDGEGECIHPELADDLPCVTLNGEEGFCLNNICVVGGPDPDPDPDPCTVVNCPHTCCGDDCVDLQTDPLNCGACGTECADDESCVSGACESECELVDWHQYVEWEGRFTSVFHSESKTDQDFRHVEGSAQARLRLTPRSPGAHAFNITSYAGTLHMRLDAVATSGVHTTTENGEVNLDLSSLPGWALLQAPTLSGVDTYHIFLDPVEMPVRYTSTGGTVLDYIVELGMLPYVAGQNQSLPACPGPISGRYEHYQENNDAINTGTTTWTLTPVGL